MSEQASRLTVKVRLEPKPLNELLESAAPAQVSWSWRRIAAALILLVVAAVAVWRISVVALPAEQGAAPSADTLAGGAITDSLNTSTSTTPATSVAATPASSEPQLASQAAPEQLVESTGAPTAHSAEQSAEQPAEQTGMPAATNAVAPHTPAVQQPAAYPTGFSRIVLTTQMRNLEPGRPVGRQVPYPQVKRLYLFTELKGYAGEVIQHRWYHQNMLKTTATLTIEDSPWRTYSENWLLDDQQGPWRVEIVDQSQKVLFEYSFTYQ